MITRRPTAISNPAPWPTRSALTAPTCGSSPQRAPQLRDIEHDPHINLAYYNPGSYEWVSASGIASLSRDRVKIRELYEPDWKAWFGQEGDPRHGTADDPGIVLIGIDIHAAVFLEVDKPKPVVLFELAKGWLTGERVEPGRHTAKTAASIVTCAAAAMPLQRYAIDVQPASRNPATNAAWSRRALGPQQDLAYARFLTSGEDAELRTVRRRNGPGTPGCRARAAESS